MKRIVLAFVFLLSAALPPSLMACSCVEEKPPCAAVGEADGVFVGRVVDISSAGSSPLRFSYRNLRVRFLVESPVRGVASGTVEVITSADSGGGCGYPFALNRRYVVYANRDTNNALATSICSRTRRVENAAEDLSFFAALPTAPPVARVFGQLGYRGNDSLFPTPPSGPMAGARVIVEGRGGPWTTVTDVHGRYEIAGLPPGDYEVKPQVDPQTKAQYDRPSIKVKVVERGCAEANAVARVHSRIRGRLSDADGRPVSDQVVEILPEGMTPQNEKAYLLPHAITKQDGLFEFDTLPAGRYFVGVSLRSPPHTFTKDGVVYPRTYFPSAMDISEAQVVALGAGDEQRGIDIVLHRPLKKREIQGIVVWSDGTPVKGAEVSLSSPEYAAVHDKFTRSDAKGAFSFAVYEGLSYAIAAVSSSGPDGKPFKGRINSSKIPVQDSPVVIRFPSPATLKGRLVDVRGEPVMNVEVELVPEETQSWEAASKSRYTLRVKSDAKGRFEMTGIAPRRYVLAVHASRPPSQYNPDEYPPAFYPGIPDRTRAAVIEIKEGQAAELSDFLMPARLAPEIVEGIVVWPDGRAVQNSFVAAEDPDFPGWSYVASVAVAADGRFALPLFAGRRYVIRATTYQDQEGRDSLWNLETKPAEILVESMSTPLALRMPEMP